MVLPMALTVITAWLILFGFRTRLSIAARLHDLGG